MTTRRRSVTAPGSRWPRVRSCSISALPCLAAPGDSPQDLPAALADGQQRVWGPDFAERVRRVEASDSGHVQALRMLMGDHSIQPIAPPAVPPERGRIRAGPAFEQIRVEEA